MAKIYFPRYTEPFLLIAIVVSIFAPFDSEAARYWRIGFLAFALAVNTVERVLFWCLHALGKLRDDESWNFRADIVRLFITEALIYVALLITLITTSTYGTQYRDIDNFSHAYAVLGIIGFLYFLTAFVMQIFTVIKFTHSLLKARVANISNTATSQKFLLCGLCVYTCALCALKVALVVLIYFGLQIRVIEPVDTFTYSFIICGLFPMALWCLYLLQVSPWGRFLPLSMALDLPPTPNCPQEIDAQVVSPLFQQMYSKANTCKGFIMNSVFLQAHSFSCHTLCFVLHCPMSL